MNLVICIISTTLIIDHVQGIYHKDLLKSETVQSGNGLDPAEYFRLKRQQKLKKRKRKYGKNNGLTEVCCMRGKVRKPKNHEISNPRSWHFIDHI